ncbi:hypothetical protein QTP81_14820 [Alteromonas sp. ASW11-36]|uniref:DUF2968 domain-containing protein n=1 Tax=Alteromonas arenosi TaxID=3055817 RepID=A0ABT7T0B9_9ALTE|nr:hypothetical protein [Alteromonas sp. ASW11-36]MDM7861873.1 hypothetical protein [Alteromonas sp. ASW11-36]
MKVSILAASVFAITAAMPSYSAVNYTELGEELEIMNSVLETSLRQSSESEAIRFRGLDTSYLAGQGVVFEVATSRGTWGLDFDLRQFIPSAPEAPLPPIIVGDGEHNLVFEVEQEWEHVIEETVRGFEEAFREVHEQMRDVRADAREISWEVRELERRKRDLNFEARTADEERKREIQADLEEIEIELANLKLRQQELTEYADTLEAEQKAQIEKQQQARLEADKAFLATFEEQIGDSLCRFGAGLRALPRDEHISFVLKNFEVNEKRKPQDRVYVFTQANIRECVQEKISADKLLEQAVVYSF